MISPLAVPRRPYVPALAAMSFIAGASVLRVAVSGPRVAGSIPGAVIFSVVLLAAASLARAVHPRVSVRSLVIGLFGGLALVVMPLMHDGGPVRLAQPTPALLTWSLVVTLVACSEEVAIRGMLFSALRSTWGTAWAVVGAAVIFALMHVPLYGWRALPLDFAVGIWLGVLRCYGGVGAAATAHAVADLAAGWLL